jgi:putative heme-binding domain-containing protein
MKQRRDLEKLHEDGTGPEAVEKAWPFLASKDRYLRFAARIAIERQPVKLWRDRALAEKDPQAIIEASIALARVGRTGNPNPQEYGKPAPGTSSGAVGPANAEDAKLEAQILTRLDTVDFTKLDLDHQLQLLRAYQVVFARLGKADAAACAKAAAHFEPLYPSANPLVNRELSQLLIFLDSKSVVGKTLALVASAKDDAAAIASDELLARNPGYAKAAESAHASRPNLQQIALIAALRNARAGWTPELRKTYFAWFQRTYDWHAGNSFPKFMDHIRTEALANFVTDAAERTALDELSKKKLPAAAANVVMPKGPGKAYTTDDVVALTQGGLHGRNFEQGKAMYAATLCARCHRFNGEGGSIGPDLTGAGNRYTMRDLAENIIDPSKVISDQYGTEEIVMKDGSSVVGRPIVEENGKLFLMTSPLAPDDLTAVNSADVKGRRPFNVSMMPPGLINTLNRDELIDLIAFITSGGNPNDKAFK